MEKKISKNQKMYPHRFGCSQNHPKAPKNPIVALWPPFSQSLGELENFYFWLWALGILPEV